MPLCSMTGFARVDGAGAGLRWTWELRSVNGKALDIRFRLPPGFEDVEAPAREKLGAALARGNVQAALSTKAELAAGAGLRINEAVLSELARALKDIGKRLEIAPPTLDGLLSVRGVVEMVEGEADDSQHAAHLAQILADLDTAVGELSASREREGAAHRRDPDVTSRRDRAAEGRGRSIPGADAGGYSGASR